MTAVQDSDAIKYFQTFTKIIGDSLQFRIDSAIIAEGLRVLRICAEHQPIVADGPMPCVMK